MDYYQRIAENFQQTIELVAMSVDSLALPIEQCSQLMSTALLSDHKIIACGNGPDGALSQLFVSNLINRLEHDRPALPAVCLGHDAANLTAIATGGHLNDIYARPVQALGQAGDVLLCITSGNCHTSLIKAVQAAHDRNMAVAVLSNSTNGQLSGMLEVDDIEIMVDAQKQPRVVELHTMIIQGLCEMIEISLFGNYQQE
jgi:phosphoheptose isomerase